MSEAEVTQERLDEIRKHLERMETWGGCFIEIPWTPSKTFMVTGAELLFALELASKTTSIERHFKLKELEELTGIGSRAFRAAIKRGELLVRRIPPSSTGSIFVTESELQKYLKACEVQRVPANWADDSDA